MAGLGQPFLFSDVGACLQARFGIRSASELAAYVESLDSIFNCASHSSPATQPTVTKDQIFEIIRRNLLEILPDLDVASIVPARSMKELGANSVDRMDVLIQTKEELGLKFPLHELASVENLQGLVDFLHAKCAAQTA